MILRRQRHPNLPHVPQKRLVRNGAYHYTGHHRPITPYTQRVYYTHSLISFRLHEPQTKLSPGISRYPWLSRTNGGACNTVPEPPT